MRVEALVQAVQIARGEQRAVDGRLAGQQRRLVGDALGDEVVEVVAVEVVGHDAQEEAVEDGRQVVVVGHLVGRAEQREQRHLHESCAPLENLRSFRMVSSEFRIAEFDLKISSRKTISASGSMVSVLRV